MSVYKGYRSDRGTRENNELDEEMQAVVFTDTEKEGIIQKYRYNYSSNHFDYDAHLNLKHDLVFYFKKISSSISNIAKQVIFKNIILKGKVFFIFFFCFNGNLCGK